MNENSIRLPKDNLLSMTGDLWPMTGEPPICVLDPDGQHVWWFHDCASTFEGRRVAAKLPLGGHGWQLVSADPLHIEPSIYCTPPNGCGTHGFFRDGRWVDA